MNTITILIVDDDPARQKLVTFVLKQAGYQVQNALDGSSALSIIEQHEPHLILMDLRLPGWMDGIVLTEMLKRDTRYHHIPILALTAYSWLETEEMARGAGCDGYIPMPINAETLLQVVAQHLQPAQQRDAASPVIS